ncbi:MAG: hypothetical protein Ct9H300mP9_5450 [Candidatus Neomarinimicrobiota bacterium]|nr:MAG: hypothetical protein Ct9H300mP9_5450 [Candidatus Neomarinimicrobiota bacterium]
MLFAIANNYGIHIISHYFEYTVMDQELTRAAILRRTMRKLGMPIFLAGTTTIVSFMSLMSHELPRCARSVFWYHLGSGLHFY